MWWIIGTLTFIFIVCIVTWTFEKWGSSHDAGDPCCCCPRCVESKASRWRADMNMTQPTNNGFTRHD